MLIGYVSDEKYSALADVRLEFMNQEGQSWATHSRASGSVVLDLPPGSYKVVLQKPGFGSKFSNIRVPSTEPFQFRLLSDELYGYAWPKMVRSGESSEVQRILTPRLSQFFLIALAQGGIGYIQYFTGLPEAIVALHLCGAVLVWLAAWNLALAGRVVPMQSKSAGE